MSHIRMFGYGIEDFLIDIEGNEIVDQLAKETLDHDIDPLTTVHFADLKPLVNSYIQQEVQSGMYLYTTEIYMLPGQMEEEAWLDPRTPPICLKVEEAMTSAEISAELVCPLRTPNFPPGMHDYDDYETRPHWRSK